MPVPRAMRNPPGLATLPRRSTVPGKQDTCVCVNKCMAAGDLRNLSSVTRKFMTSPDDRGKALVSGMFSLGWEDLESSLGEEKAAVVFDVDLEG